MGSALTPTRARPLRTLCTQHRRFRLVKPTSAHQLLPAAPRPTRARNRCEPVELARGRRCHRGLCRHHLAAASVASQPCSRPPRAHPLPASRSSQLSPRSPPPSPSCQAAVSKSCHRACSRPPSKALVASHLSSRPQLTAPSPSPSNSQLTDAAAIQSPRLHLPAHLPSRPIPSSSADNEAKEDIWSRWMGCRRMHGLAGAVAIALSSELAQASKLAAGSFHRRV
ncbi:hypothetical protein BJ912DRAFT_621925 [Pholiota molesta]|nr:hypothetical protein BJ912DRAFT_621925 [Pholiota molesta]